MSDKKRTFSELFREWDEDRINLADTLESVGRSEPDEKHHNWKPRHVRSIEEREVRFFDKIYPILAAVLSIVIISALMLTVIELPIHGAVGTPDQNEVMDRYVSKGTEETGAVNTVAGIILDYRAFDTLGESFVLFTAVSAVLMLLLTAPGETPPPDDDKVFNLYDDVILRLALRLLAPVILIYGIYVILGGHLGPGGGFSGGAIIGAGFILFSVSCGPEKVSRIMNMRVFRTVTLIALSFYALSKCYSFFTGANHIESIFNPGTPGNIISAGLILPLNISVGLVVACTMYGFYSLFKRGRI